MRKIRAAVTFVIALAVCAVALSVLNQSQEGEVLLDVGDDVLFPVKNAENSPLSADGKRIIMEGEVLLDVGDDVFFTFFTEEDPSFCTPEHFEKWRLENDPANTPSILFCTDKAVFRNHLTLSSAVVSPDASHIGFTVEVDLMQGDMLPGIFSRATGAVHFLTSYYLGHRFISFSPSGKHFVYIHGCFEGMCAHTVRDTDTLEKKAYLTDPNPKYAGGELNTVFVRWVSDNEVEYKVGDPYSDEYELMRKSF